MNRYKKILLSFVLPFFCLLISVSYAGVYEKDNYYNVITSNFDTYPSNTYVDIYSELNSKFSSYHNTLYRYFENKTTEPIDEFLAQFLEYLENQYNLDSYVTARCGQYRIIHFYNSAEVEYALKLNTDGTANLMANISNNSKILTLSNVYMNSNPSPGPQAYLRTFSTDGLWKLDGNYAKINLSSFPVVSNASLKEVTYTSSLGYIWDGESYYYKVESEEPGAPSLPSNAEIAQAVQAFYNSDYYKNNADFEDFLVLYNYNTQYFSFVGHNFGSNLGQVIVPPDYEYEGYSYKQDWWKFFLRNVISEVASNLWNKYYWLYSTNDLGETITSDGKGAIQDLINLHFSTNSIIVYSTTDYPVVKIETDENGVLNPVQGTVPGNQYTYDEDLDPTTNEYNPLENFIPTSPSQSILGDVDFNEINNAFEENKNILNIENASWLFSANNQLVNYFLGFLSFLIVLIIISRLLGG